MGISNVAPGALTSLAINGNHYRALIVVLDVREGNGASRGGNRALQSDYLRPCNQGAAIHLVIALDQRDVMSAYRVSSD
ncbi:hypothetical protein BgiMline_016005 [Biomphalaria glabrata]